MTHGIPTTAREPVRWTPPALVTKTQIANDKAQREGGVVLDAPEIHIRVPTPYERDSWAATLVRGGVMHYSKKQVRDAFMAGLAFLTPDENEFAQAEHGMEMLWSYVDAQEKMHALQQQLFNELAEENLTRPVEQQRTTEQLIEEVEAEIKSEVEMPSQQRVRLVAIQQRIQNTYEPLRNMMADLAEQETRQRWLSIETYVVNWTGLPHTPIGNGRGGITRTEAIWLRKEIGEQAFNEVADLIYAMHGLDGDEEKNLASLIESYSALTGSTAAESMASDEPGSSKVEPTIETPDSASPATTD